MHVISVFAKTPFLPIVLDQEQEVNAKQQIVEQGRLTKLD
jgi:hypothetical protein